MPVGYILVLFAMTMAPVSHVAPIREMSMMVGAYFCLYPLFQKD
jgi:hypothetical protein